MHSGALEQQQPSSRHQRTGAHEQTRPVTVRKRPETTRESEHNHGHRQCRQAALQWRVAADLLQEQDQEEEHDRQARVHREGLHVSRREVAPAEQREWQHRVAGPRLEQREQAEQARAGDHRQQHSRARPAQAWLLDQREHRSAQPSRAQCRPREIDPPRLRVTRLAGRDHHQDQRHACDHQRDVHQEDPAPRGERQQLAARQRAEHAGDRTPRRPAADRPAALGLREGVDDHRKRARYQQRPRHTLHRPCGHQHPDRRRQRARHRGDPKARHAEREHAPLAKQVAERAPDQDQRPKRQQVAVHHPLLRRQAAPRARWIVGSATFTTVPSSSTIPEPRMHANSVRRLVLAESSPADTRALSWGGARERAPARSAPPATARCSR